MLHAAQLTEHQTQLQQALHLVTDTFVCCSMASLSWAITVAEVRRLSWGDVMQHILVLCTAAGLATKRADGLDGMEIQIQAPWRECTWGRGLQAEVTAVGRANRLHVQMHGCASVGLINTSGKLKTMHTVVAE